MRKNDSTDGSVTRNLKMIRWLKTELLTSIAALFKLMLKNNKDRLLELLGNIIMSTYLLAKRLGFSFQQVDRKLNENIKRNISREHQIETWYGDLSSLFKHLDQN